MVSAKLAGMIKKKLALHLGKKKGLLLLFGDEMKYGKAFVLVAGLEGEDVGAGYSGT